MLTSGRYLYVLFCCQQSVEKALKSLIVERTGALPPRIHNLVRLADVAGIEVPIPASRFLKELSAYYIQSRYPEEIEAAASAVTRSIAAETLKKTEETTQWLFSMPG
jgi:HEPN domain-containing protein